MPEWLRKWAKSDIRNGIAVLYVVMVLVYIYVLVYHPVPAENKDLINVIGGHVIAGLGLVLAYYYGSSKSDPSKDKDSDV